MLNRAFNNTSPANAVFNNQVAAAGSTEASQTAFALQFGNSFAGLTDAQLSTRVLGNLGVLPNAELEAAVTQYFADNGLANRGLVVLQLGQILSTLETAPAPQNIFNDAAKAWNTEVEKSFIYSSNASNTTPYVGDFVGPVDQGKTFALTQGVDAGAAFTGSGGRLKHIERIVSSILLRATSFYLISHNVQPPSKTVRAAAAWRPGRRAGASGWTTGRNDD